MVKRRFDTPGASNRKGIFQSHIFSIDSCCLGKQIGESLPSYLLGDGRGSFDFENNVLKRFHKRISLSAFRSTSNQEKERKLNS
ncbi:hypothetical protein CEXT_390181 [Caerostris extrusa]|uniref:Uncharacterized protein n=1 Tax=Caerostris extrusa TaxID=172846 RepID=A0AAV4NLP2_CAEEX|nr:hypothetical protein CEXT_390181 [Caerostris extrusa]